MWTQSGSVSTTFTFNNSGGTSSSITIQIRRINDLVTLYIPSVSATSGTASTQFSSGTSALPAWARPSGNTQYTPVNAIKNNGSGVSNPGLLLVNTAGTMVLLRDNTAASWTNATSCGLSNPVTVTYYVGTGS